MVEVKANVAITSVTITMSEQEAALLMKVFEQCIFADRGTPIGKLSDEIYESLDLLEVKPSTAKLRYAGSIGLFVQEMPL